MKRFLLSFLLAAALFPITALAKQDCSKYDNYTPIKSRYEAGLLFRVERCGKPHSYVFGTMHADDPNIIKTARPAFGIVNIVQSLGIEYVLNEQFDKIASKFMFLPRHHEEGLERLIGSTLYQQLLEAFKKHNNIEVEQISRMQPWAAAIMLQYPESVDNGVILDFQLQQYAQIHKGIEVYGLEQPQEQLSIFSTLKLDTQIALLNDTLENLDTTKELNQALTDAYIDQDLNQIHKIGDLAFAQQSDQKLAKKLKYKLLKRRNITMTKRMIPRIRKGSTLIAIGALHLLGENGVLLQLEERGYYIYPVKQ
jgi:uncharacterized protein YbaP (TraB family)